MLKKCIRCGKQFDTQGTNAKYCMPCRRPAYKDLRRKHYYSKPALMPTGSFDFDIARRRLNGESLCMWCGQEFTAVNHHQKFCCDAHALNFYRQLFNR